MKVGKGPRPRDANQLAAYIVGLSTNETPEDPAAPKKDSRMQALSRLGASKGGKARKAALSAEERSAMARRAAAARWGTRAKQA